MPPRNYFGKSWTYLIVCSLLIGVYGCDELCYKPRVGNATFQVDEDDAIADGVCYSTCVLKVRKCNCSNLYYQLYCNYHDVAKTI